MISQREAEIDSYIQQKSDCKLQGSQWVYYRGQQHELAVYHLPIRLLTFNITNGRFLAELSAKQAELKRQIDPTKGTDAKIIREMLLGLNAEDTKALMGDLKVNGQLDPGLITHDGAIINANRRTAILQSLEEESGNEKYAYLKVSRLPKGVDAKELWQIEARLQFGKDLKQAYAPVNELLKLRAGRASGLSKKQILASLGGRYSEKQLDDRVEVLGLIDEYLVNIGKKGEYHIITDKGHVERFNSLQSVVKPLRVRGSKTLKKDLPNIIEVAFKLIGTGLSHWKIRELRGIAELDAARSELLKSFKNGVISSDAKEVKERYDQALDILDFQNDKDKPERLIGRALNAVSQIDQKHASVKTAAFKKLLSDLKAVLAKFK